MVSDTGEVMSFKRSRIGKRLSPIPATGGYRVVKLGNSNNGKRIHRLVLEAFVGPCPSGMEACHNNGDPADNRLENLRWDTKSANMFDRSNHRRGQAGKSKCPAGHAYDERNTRWSRTPTGLGRQCRECDRLRNLRNRAKARIA